MADTPIGMNGLNSGKPFPCFGSTRDEMTENRKCSGERGLLFVQPITKAIKSVVVLLDIPGAGHANPASGSAMDYIRRPREEVPWMESTSYAKSKSRRWYLEGMPRDVYFR